MRAGDLRERVEFRRVVLDQDDLGGAVEQEQVLFSCWAKVSVPAARNDRVAGSEMAVRTHEVTIRKFSVEPRTGDVAVWRGTRLKVLATRPTDDLTGLILDCQTEVA